MITMIIGTGFVVTKAVLDYAIVGGGESCANHQI